MKGYKLKSEHPTHVVVVHPDGTHMTIAKSGLSKPMLERVKKLPQHLAPGGEADDGESANPFSPFNAVSDWAKTSDAPIAKFMRGDDPSAPVTGETPFNKAPGSVDGPRPDQPDAPKQSSFLQDLVGGTAQGAPQTDYPQAPLENQRIDTTGKAKDQSQGNPNLGMPSPGGQPQLPGQMPQGQMPGDYQKAFGQIAGGIKAGADATQAGAKDMVAAQEQHIRAMDTAKNVYDQHIAKLDSENTKLTEDIQNSKIDPNRVWNSASTGNKVMAGIGILLSGIGSGLTGQQNMALGVIQKSIDRDIDAQKADLGKKENLLSANMRKYGNAHAAYQATAMQLTSVVQGQIAAAAAKMNGAQAQAQAQQAIGQLNLQKSEMAHQLALGQANQAMGAFLGSGALAGAKGVNLEDSRLAPYKDRIVQLPSGGIALAKSGKEREEIQGSLGHLTNIKRQLQNADKFMDTEGRTLPGTDANASAASIRDGLILSMNKLHDLNRLTEPELDMFKSMVPDPGSWNQGKAKAKLAELSRMVADKEKDLYQNGLEGVSGGGRGDQVIAGK